MSRKSFPFYSTGGEIRDLDQPGYYGGYSTMAQQRYWEEATRSIVTGRVANVHEDAPIRFFSREETPVISAVFDRLMPQDDRSERRTIPILAIIDERLHTNSLNGFRYEDMPSDQEAYRLGIKAIGDMAQRRFQQPFAELTVHRQELLLKSLHDGEPDPRHEIWQRLPVQRFWALLMEDCVTAYYSHPWAWDEVGFGGPAYPRGYMRLENGLPEPWEKDEQRYDWNVPVDSVSVIDEENAPPAHSSLHGHGGSH
jgi:hypothetical protein